MEGMDRYPSHPARDASVRSMRAVEAGDRESWIVLFADDAVVEDPIGQSMFDSEGNGHRGREAITAFYDNALSSCGLSPPTPAAPRRNPSW